MKRPTCSKCEIKMVSSTALKNTWVSFDDFGNDAGQPGTTESRIGKAVKVKVWKCPECGHSFEK